MVDKAFYHLQDIFANHVSLLIQDVRSCILVSFVMLDIFPVGPYMDRLVKTAGDVLTPPRVTRKNTVSPHVSRPALDMELYVPLLLIHGNDLLFLISGLF